MKRTLLPVVVAAVVAVATLAVAPNADARGSGATTSPPTTTAAASTTGRPYEVHVPPNYSANVPAPLLLILHGYRASGALESLYLQLTSATDAAGMLTVAPDGTLNGRGKRFWNATDACCATKGETVDDAAYLMAIVREVEATYNVDRKRTFIVGHSNGGFMAYRMACDHADTFAAVASLAGATFADPRRCAPSVPVATLEIHGTADDTIPYDGGKILRHAYPGAIATTRMWARYDGCKLVPDDPEPAPHDLVQDLPPATVTAYSTGCKANGHAELWTQQDGTHIPKLSPTFGEQVVTYLMAHPKP
ncbi:MAG: alpha/beta hydrolase-fold protein [Acidimicrobiia bacterium]